MDNYFEFTKQYQKHEQTFKSFHKVFKKSLQDNRIDKHEYESLFDIFNENNKEKNEFFIKVNIKLNFSVILK